jgi:carbonic anhydrase
MKQLTNLFKNNRRWAAETRRQRPDFFQTLSQQQSPEYLWIGCSDSRVPANEIVGLMPGELFVHRNVANLVVHSDMNCLSVLQYAVDILHVKHIIVCGHYGCGGIRAALEKKNHGLIDNWLRPIRDLQNRKKGELAALKNDEERVNRLCELNAIEQAINVSNTTIVQDAWIRGQTVIIHCWIYGINNGLARNLGTVSSPAELKKLQHDLGA